MTVTAEDVVFTAYTHVTDDEGLHHAFAPGDEVPGWARGKVGAHVTSFASQWAQVGPLDVNDVPDAPVSYGAPVQVRSDPQQPPVSGPGSSRPAWATYAKALDEPVTPEMSRQDIIDLLIRHGRIIDNG